MKASATHKAEAAIAVLQRLVREGEAEKIKFVNAINENPLHALEWSQGMFVASAAAAAAAFMLRLLNELAAGGAVDAVAQATKYAGDTAMRMARYSASFSTSPTSNLLNVCSAQAYAQLAQQLADLDL